MRNFISFVKPMAWSLTLLWITVFASSVYGQTAAPGIPVPPDDFTFLERDSRQRFDENNNLIFPNFEYLPGYFLLGSGGVEDDDDYDSQTVFRVEYGVENDGTTRSKIPETLSFTLGAQTFKRLVRDLRAGEVAEPYDEVVVARLIDDVDPDPETPLAPYTGTLADLCTGTLPGSNQTCAAAGIPPHKNRNSFFHQYTDGPASGNAPPVFPESSSACDAAYDELLGVSGDEQVCSVVRFQSERVRCFKCVSNAYAINRGSDNIFSKTGGRTENNIGRLDLIINAPIVITEAQAAAYAADNGGANLLESVGFLLMERNGNDHYALAAITELKNIDDMIDGTDTTTADSLNVSELQNFARSLRTYDNLDFETPGTAPFDDRPQLVATGRSAKNMVTQLGPVLNTKEKLEDNTGVNGQVTGFDDIWSSTTDPRQLFLTSVFMSSREQVGDTGHFYGNRPDQNLGTQRTEGSFISLAALGFSFGDPEVEGDPGENLLKNGNVEFFGVSLFPADIRTDDGIEYDLITLSNIPRDTSAASGDVGGLDFTGGGGFFFAEDTSFFNLTLRKVASPLTFTAAGEQITYTFEVENTGNGVVDNLAINDPLLADENISVSCNVTTLNPGEVALCSADATYVIDSNDVTNESVFNTATATACKLGTAVQGACSGTDVVESNEDNETVRYLELSLVKTAAPTTYTSANEPIAYSFLVTNTGNVDITNLAINDPLPGLTGLSCPTTTLAIDASTTCTATYTTTVQDVSALRTITNTATATGDDPDGGEVTSNEDDATVTFTAQPALSLVKTASPTTYTTADADIAYSFLVTNTGNVTITSLAINDPLPGLTGLSCPTTTLTIGANTTCTATYTTTALDVSTARTITNTATATGNDPGQQPVTSNEDDATVTFTAVPSLSLEKTASPTTYETAGAGIAYSFLVTNTGNVTITSLAINDPLPGLTGLSCPTTTLTIGANTTCTATYTTTAQDVSDLRTITNTATATGNDPDQQTVTSNEDDATVTFAAQPALRLVKTADPTTYTIAGTEIDYSFLVTNIGNAVITNLAINDPLPGLTGLSCPTTTLAIDASTTCTATYTTTAGDVSARRTITNTATATGSAPDESQVTSNEDDAVVTFTSQPELSLVKTAEPTAYTAADVDVTYSFLVTNTGNVEITNLAINDPLPGLTDLSCPITTLAVDASTTCTATYTTTAQDVSDLRTITNTATATGDDPDSETVTSNEDTETVTFTAEPALTLVKTAEPTSYSEITDITYSFLVTNTGNVEITNLVINDALPGLSDPLCPTTTLAIGANTTCTATYTTTADDVSSERTITNTATATGDDPDQETVTSNEDTETVTFTAQPSLSLVKSAEPTTYTAADVNVTYSFLVTNTGNVEITNLAINDPLPGLTDLSCPITTLAADASTTCTATYTTTAQDVSDSRAITNTATATGDDPDSETVTSNPDTETVTFEGSSAVTVTKSSDPASGELVAPGDTITYTLEVVVAGAATTDDVVLSDALGAGLTFDEVTSAGDFTALGTTFTLSQGAEVGTYAISYTATVDADATGSVGNVVTATGGTCVETGDCTTAHPLLEVAASGVCVLDTPFVDYSVNIGTVQQPVSSPVAGDSKGLDPTTVTIRWVPQFEGPDDDVIELTGEPLSGTVLWPGVTVDENDVATNWPGWEFNEETGFWTPVPTALRPNIAFDVVFNGTTNRTIIAYPEPTPSCAATPEVFSEPTKVSTLNDAGKIALALMLMMLGLVVVRRTTAM